MQRRLLLALLSAALAPAPAGAASRIHFPYSPCTPKSKLPGCVKKAHSTELGPYKPRTYPDHGLKDTMTDLGRTARGFYITPFYIHRMGALRTARAMKRAHMTAVVIDMKDDFGNLLYPSRIPLAQRQVRVLYKDPAAMTKTLRENGIYTIARVVSFKDSRLPYARPDLSVRAGARAERLFAAGANWLDAYSPEVRDYLVDIALELEALGFDEVQFDYIRFPKGNALKYGTWLHQAADKRDRSTLISSFLERVDRALRIPISVDIYGLTTLVDGDPRTLGQTIEAMAKYVEAISPMMYANGMGSYFKGNKITERIYSFLHCGMWRARQKAQGIVLRPFLQAYSNSIEHMWGPDFIKRQVGAAERAGADGFLFWNPTMRNVMPFAALGSIAKQLARFGKNTGRHLEAKNRPGAWCPQRGDVFKGERAAKESADE
jgi:hypothetical protein